MIVSQFMPHDAAPYISHSHTGSFRVVVGLQINPALRIGAKEDAQAQGRADLTQFAGQSMARQACGVRYALNGLNSGTSKDLKSATFRVTTVKPWILAVAAIIASS